MYREPFGGTPAVLAALPIDRVEPTPYQRDPSEPHVKRLMTVIETLGRFLDPIITVRRDDDYWTPNGNHRLQAMRKLGAQVGHRAGGAGSGRRVQDSRAQYREGAQPQGEVARDDPDAARAGRRALLRAPSASSPSSSTSRPSSTLGAAYEQRPRLSGGAYNPVLRRIDEFLDERLPRALKERTRRAGLLLAIDDEVTAIVDKLKKRGLTSPYLRPFVVARINPIRFSTSTEFDFDDVLGRMQKNAAKFNVEKVRQEDVVRAGGGPAEDAEE